MIANFGYEDGSGNYYISLDTNKCSECDDKDCIDACPSRLFQKEMNDWDDEIIVVDADKCNSLMTECSTCKSISDHLTKLPCQSACKLNAIVHSW